MEVVNVLDNSDTAKLNQKFLKGKVAAILNIQPKPNGNQPFYTIDFKTCAASGNDKNVAQQIINSVIENMNNKQFPTNQKVAELHFAPIVEGRAYKYLDFLLPGMLGFSLLSAGIFGTAFVFFSLRQTLVLKRFFATPVSRTNIILSEGIARLALQLMSAAIVILVGHFVFDFTLVHGVATFFQMLLLSAIGLLLFLGMGFVISSLAKNDASIPPLANSITMPQLLLSGVFMPVNNFPNWLQPICKFLPLTQFNDAMRSIAFEGKSIFECGTQLGILGIWILMTYIIANRVFKWE
jgi:ABC-2 type transport system permease protein